MTESEKQDSIFLNNFISERDGILESPETRYAIDIVEHPQLDHITFYPDNSVYKMWDSDGNYFTFKALDYSEEIEEKLVPEVMKLYKRNVPR